MWGLLFIISRTVSLNGSSEKVNTHVKNMNSNNKRVIVIAVILVRGRSGWGRSSMLMLQKEP